jgi:hypothetical protein
LSGHCQDSSRTAWQQMATDDPLLRHIIEIWPSLPESFRHHIWTLCNQ